MLCSLVRRKREPQVLSRRHLSVQELAAERAKAAASENKLKEQLVTREREITAVQARMQASYQDHVNETQQLQGKVGYWMSSSCCLMIFLGFMDMQSGARRDLTLEEVGVTLMFSSSMWVLMNRVAQGGVSVWEHLNETSCSGGCWCL